MRRTLLLSIVVVLASGCISQGSTRDAPNGSSEMNASNISGTSIQGSVQAENIVYYTSNGFTPSSITVQQGETVTWINNASGGMWVASDRHPTHTQYAGSSLRQHCRNGDQTSAAFDQCSPGDRFSFTFERTGVWSYHNHVYAAHGGTVTVR